MGVALMWPACWLGYRIGILAAVGITALAGLILSLRGRAEASLLTVVVLGAMAGAGAHAADARMLASLGSTAVSARMIVTASTDSLPTRFGSRLVVTPDAIERNGLMVPWHGPALALTSRDRLAVTFGERLSVRGTIVAAPGRVGRVLVAGRVSNPTLESLGPTDVALIGFANRLRDRVLGRLDSSDPGEGLLAGFLVGDTAGVSDADLESLRRSGLTHYVAVSGSNVATFLALWWLVLAPLASHPRLRALTGIVGVIVFVVVTRAEPSVVRAGVMVTVMLAGRLMGWAFDRFTALALAVLACLALAPRLSADVGFQLSVAATLGVMIGAGMFDFHPKAVATVVGASLSAQIAVAPILLLVFGSLPALAPLANLAAAPLVGASTAVGGIGALSGFGPLVAIGALLADAVLWVGRLAAPWPQLGPVAASVVGAAGLAAWRFSPIRAPLTLVGAVLVAVSIVPWGPAVDSDSVVFLDVGQGDAALIVGRETTILIDGGPDPGRLAEKLAEFGVDHVDLLVVTHVHADHVEGLRAVVGRMPVGSAWLAFESQSTPASEWLTDALAEVRVPIDAPPVGTVVSRDGIRLEVIAPLRRYASPNDQSLVVEATVAGRRFLLSGDIEVIAQSELTGLSADVLKVPHHGASTSGPDWLAAVSPELAVISVGPNDFGHPAEWVIEVLESSGATVVRTDVDGDIVVGPAGLASPTPWWRLWP